MNAIATAKPTGRVVSNERLLRLGLLQEPAGYVDGPNLFQYVGGNPVNRLDPTGLTDKVSETIMQGEYSGIKVSVDVEAQSSAGGHVHIGPDRAKFMWQPEANKFERTPPSVFKKLMSNQAFRAEMKAAIPKIKAVAAPNKGTIACAAVVLTLSAAQVAQAAEEGGPQAALDTAIGEATDFTIDYAVTLAAAPIVGAAAQSLATSSALASSTIPALAAGGTTLAGGGHCRKYGCRAGRNRRSGRWLRRWNRDRPNTNWRRPGRERQNRGRYILCILVGLLR